MASLPSRAPFPVVAPPSPFPTLSRALLIAALRALLVVDVRASTTTCAASPPSTRARILPTALHLPGHPSLLPSTLPSSMPPFLTLSWAACLTSLQAPPPPPPPWCAFFCRFCTTSSFSLLPICLFLLLLSSFLPPFHASPPFLHLLPLRICHLGVCYRLPLGDRDPPSSPNSAPSPSSSSSLSLYFPHPLTSSSASLLSLSAAAGSCPCFVAFHTFPPRISPLSGAAADYFAAIPPRISPLSSTAADYLTAVPPCITPLSSAAADYPAVFPPPLMSPLSGAAAHYSAVIPPPLISPNSGAAADYSAMIPPPLISPPSSAAANYSAIIPPLISPLNDSASDYLVSIPPPLLSPHMCSIATPFPQRGLFSLLPLLPYLLSYPCPPSLRSLRCPFLPLHLSYLPMDFPSSLPLCLGSAIPSPSPLLCRCHLWYWFSGLCL
ncbi:unnamed protein product [Closterium sp. NIES-65]|nr:unnamed protein product [Closterium sp. NIES-65]